MGVQMLIFATFALLQGVTNFSVMQLGGIIVILYFIWAIGDFFDKKKPVNYVKAFLAYVVGMLTAVLFAVAVGQLINILIH